MDPSAPLRISLRRRPSPRKQPVRNPPGSQLERSSSPRRWNCCEKPDSTAPDDLAWPEVQNLHPGREKSPPSKPFPRADPEESRHIARRSIKEDRHPRLHRPIDFPPAAQTNETFHAVEGSQRALEFQRETLRPLTQRKFFSQ